VCRSGIFLAHYHPIAAGVECNIRTVATDRIRLDYGVNSGRFQEALGHLRLPLVTECLHDNKVGFAHLLNLTPEIDPRDVYLPGEVAQPSGG
jgi:hypothetical protein